MPLIKLALDFLDDLDLSNAGNVADDKGDGIGIPLRKRLRHLIGAIAGLLDHLLYKLTAFFADIGTAAQNARDGRSGKAAFGGDVINGYAHFKVPFIFYIVGYLSIIFFNKYLKIILHVQMNVKRYPYAVC